MDVISAVNKAIESSVFNKAILSLPIDKSIVRASAVLFRERKGVKLQLAVYYTDGKVKHKNYPAEEAAAVIEREFTDNYRQLNLIAETGEIQWKRTKSGRLLSTGRLAAPSGSEASPGSHNRDKNYIIDDKSKHDFLIALGIQDKTGRIKDKGRHKFRQINKFLEILSDQTKILPVNKDKPIVIWDLCCGKSYLTFAVYYYFTRILNKPIKLYGVDRKQDVIDYCDSLAHKLGYSISFLNMDINDFHTDEKPDIVISLHACNTATDIVLLKAVWSGAKLILSTPCCHHEMAGQLKKGTTPLDFIIDQPILKQKFCYAATDSLRTLWLKAKGYEAGTLEFIDPEDTPKNVMIRAVLRDSISTDEIDKYSDEYKGACAFLGIEPYLKKYL